MKKIVAVLLLACLSNPLFAVQSKKPKPIVPENLAVNIDFDYLQHTEDGKLHQDLVNNNLAMNTGNHSWTIIQDEQPGPAEHVILLGRIQHANTEELTMNFLVLETGAMPKIISRPVLTMKYNQNARLAIKEGNRTLHLMVSART